MSLPSHFNGTRYRVTWRQEITWEAFTEAESMKDALQQAVSGELFEQAVSLGETDSGFNVEEAGS